MAYNADNSVNPEIFDEGPEPASIEQLSLLYAQALSLYEKAQDPSACDLFREHTVINYDSIEHTATYRYGKYASLGQYNEIAISFVGSWLSLTETESAPQETGRIIGKRGMIIDEAGNSLKSEQAVWQEDKSGFFRDLHISQVQQEKHDVVPKKFADTAQQLIDDLWVVPKQKKILGRLFHRHVIQ